MKKIIIGVVVVVLVVLGIWYFAGGVGGPNSIKSFAVEGPDLFVIGKAIGKVEVWAMPENAKELVRLGTMELVEGDESTDQSWAMPIPSKKEVYTQVLARAFAKDGTKSGEKALNYKTAEEITGALYPAKSDIGIPGRILTVDVSTRKFTMITESYGTITLAIKSDTKFTDPNGKAITIGAFKKGYFIQAVGNFSEESTFDTTEINITKYSIPAK